MSIRPTLLVTMALVLGLCALSARAHDPREFDRMNGPVAEKPLPKTCANLDDPYAYRIDLDDPDVSLLKEHCDAAKAQAAKEKAAKSRVLSPKPKAATKP